MYLRVAAAPWAGWWLTERPGKVYADGAVVVRSYDPVRSVSLLAGRAYRAVLLDRRGQVEDSVALRPDGAGLAARQRRGDRARTSGGASRGGRAGQVLAAARGWGAAALSVAAAAVRRAAQTCLKIMMLPV